MDPIKRDTVYDYYWRFAAERTKIFYKRFQNDVYPWTEDIILQKYKFCNSFRACDRVSQYLIKDICYQENPFTEADLLFQIIAFRFFSRIDTWESLIQELGHQPNLEDLKNDSFEKALTKTKSNFGKIYTGAFILCANNAYGRTAKHLNHVSMFKDMFFTREVYQRIKDASSLEIVFNILHEIPLIGDFMAYQIAIDINYSEITNFSENDFTKAGPGALRGISKVFSDTNGLNSSEVIMWMTEHQEDEFSRLGIEFNGLFGRPLHAIDCQNLFCEVDKYCRVAVPEISSSRKRIKACYKKTANSIEFFFPPKWGINNQVHARKDKPML